MASNASPASPGNRDSSKNSNDNSNKRGGYHSKTNQRDQNSHSHSGGTASRGGRHEPGGDPDEEEEEPRYLDENRQIMETNLKDQYDEDVTSAIAKEDSKVKKKNRPRGFTRADRQE